MSSIDTREGEAALVVPDDWLQGRTLFGGLQAAIALAAMRTLVKEAPLRTIQVTFIAPVPGGAVRAKAKILRSGKNTTHVEARIVDGEATLALAVGVFGSSRPSQVALHPVQPPVKPENPFEMRYVAGVAPAFTQHFKARWIVGAPPFTRVEKNPQSVIELGLRDTGMATEAHVVALADFIPPVALSWIGERVAAASLTWMLEILSEDFTSLPLDGWRIDATMTAAGDGYTSQSLVLWGPGGVPVALGRQSMVVFG
ncbi:MAG TPA: thioesterase family protein [Usitatibacter sp.]